MGLDMYLWSQNKTSIDPVEEVKLYNEWDGMGTPPTESYSKEVMYWRKANAIHGWFVRNTQGGLDNCQVSYVDKEQLKELLKILQTVHVDKTQAEFFLPSQGGFFFGNTDYNEYYFEQVEETGEALYALVNSDEFNDEDVYYTYSASW